MCVKKEHKMSDEKQEHINQINQTKESFNEICRILNKRRPYRSSDSKKQHFIPDLIITLLITLNFVGGMAQSEKPVESKKQNIESAVAKRAQANYANYYVALQKTRGY